MCFVWLISKSKWWTTIKEKADEKGDQGAILSAIQNTKKKRTTIFLLMCVCVWVGGLEKSSMLAMVWVLMLVVMVVMTTKQWRKPFREKKRIENGRVIVNWYLKNEKKSNHEIKENRWRSSNIARIQKNDLPKFEEQEFNTHTHTRNDNWKPYIVM